jgi:hypothetical protein
MAFYNRREFLQASAASAYLFSTLKLDAQPSAPANINDTGKAVRVQGKNYAWEWSPENDQFRLLDRWGMTIARGKLQPAVLVQPEGTPGSLRCTSGKPARHEIHDNQLAIHYTGVNGSAELFASWKFDDEGFWSEPVDYQTSTAEDVVRFYSCAQGGTDRALPGIECDDFVIPGITSSCSISPIIGGGPSGAYLNQISYLGRGWASDPEVLATQQWGLPVHYFCGFHTTPYSFQQTPHVDLAGATVDDMYYAFCCGLAELPGGDLMIDNNGGRASMFVNYRSDLWKQLHGPGRLRVGARLYWAVGQNYYEAIRGYYLGLLKSGIIEKKVNSAHKNAVALAPSFCSYGEQVARERVDKLLDETTLEGTYDDLSKSGMQTHLYIVDGGWESGWGSLHHSEKRLPHFEQLLARVRADGKYLGLWSAFMRCEFPSDMGLTTDNMLHLPNGKAYLHIGVTGNRFHILDSSQPEVQAVLRRRAKEFMQRYKPDFVKFDFGYEIPSLSAVAPKNLNWAGERFMAQAMEVIIPALREENPDLVVLYYSLSPFFAKYFDLNSPDDLGRCTEDFELEANRRFFFSSLMGEIGVPTWGSGGYEWLTMPDIWFDSAALGTIGSLLSFSGPGAQTGATPERIAKFNGLAHVIRYTNTFSILPVDPEFYGPERGPHAPSWARTENGEVVLVALRQHGFDGRKGTGKFRDLVSTNASVVVASQTKDGIAQTDKLAIVPYGDGELTLKRTGGVNAQITEHYFRGGKSTQQLSIASSVLRVPLHEKAADGAIVEWYEVEIH